jgi:methylenetetrahydrofolate dehydrogenase (NADP+)/methenyltetrahydrofolate cyclohydrolase
MRATLIDGKAIAESLREEVKHKVKERVEKGLPVPGLATVIVGDNPASKVYVRMKHKACQEAGITSIGHELPKIPPCKRWKTWCVN